MLWVVSALLFSFPASAEVCDKGEELAIFGTYPIWAVLLLLSWVATVHRSRMAACALALALTVPLLVTLLEGNIDADPFVRAMVREGCRLPYREGLNRSLAYAALAPVAMAFPFLADRLWPRRATSP